MCVHGESGWRSVRARAKLGLGLGLGFIEVGRGVVQRVNHNTKKSWPNVCVHRFYEFVHTSILCR